MKGIPCKLTAWTSWGATCFRGEFASMKEAREKGCWLVENGFAFSYKLTKKKKQ